MVSRFSYTMGCSTIITNYLSFKKDIFSYLDVFFNIFNYFIMKKLKKLFFILLWCILIMQNHISNALEFWRWNVNSWLEWSSSTLDIAIQWILVVALSFLYLVAVVYWLRGGYNILTAAWDEEKVKRWKKIIIHAIVWLIVIWLVNSVINFVVTNLLWTS